MPIFNLIVIFIFGLLIGSFTNVIVWRLPRDESIVKPRSHCPYCNRMIKSYDNIPVISYLFLGGKCRYCKKSISIRYPLIELAVGILYILCFVIADFSFNLRFFTGIFLASTLTPIFIIDLEHQVIPEHITFPGILVGLILSPFRMGGWSGLLNAVIGAVVGGGVLFIVSVLWKALFKKEGMGFGDVELLAFLGTFLGWKKILLVIFGSSLLGSVVGIILMFFFKRFREKRILPFGPFISLTGFIVFIWGDRILHLILTKIFFLA
ncbi:prepilin peptidase [bacterium]|nr:prepilin peptidase [bacterium]